MHSLTALTAAFAVVATVLLVIAVVARWRLRDIAQTTLALGESGARGARLVSDISSAVAEMTAAIEAARAGERTDGRNDPRGHGDDARAVARVLTKQQASIDRVRSRVHDAETLSLQNGEALAAMADSAGELHERANEIMALAAGLRADEPSALVP